MHRRNPSRLLHWCRTILGNVAKPPEDGIVQRKGMKNELVDSDPGSQHPEFLRSQISRYNYESLDGPDKIRTLKLHATKERIECSLQQISFSEGGYEALSYVWGSSDQLFNAYILDEDGNELGYIPLTANLQTALCDLRDAEEVTTDVFWIDQICIKQDGEEKNHQVALMGDIYRNAARVITYLGPAVADENEEKCGIALLQLLQRHFSDNYALIYEAGGLLPALLMKSKFPVVTLPEDLQDEADFDEEKYVVQGWRWLLQVAYSQWARRLWIVQEQLLNQKLVMLHGSSLLSWDAVASIPLLFAVQLLPKQYLDRFWQEHLQSSCLQVLRIEDSVYALWHARQMMKKIGRAQVGRGLLQNMAMHQTLECWDPRDRIFALLAISSDISELGIVPDYCANTSRVFVEASVCMLLASPDLVPLEYACRWANGKALSEDQSENPELALPSVTPSWALGPAHPLIPYSTAFEVCTPHPRTSIRGGPPRFLLNFSILVLKGRFLDRISMSSSVMFCSQSSFLVVVDESYIQDDSQILMNWHAVLSHLGIILENAARLCRAIAGMPTWSPTQQEGHSIDETYAFYFWSYYRYFANGVREHGPQHGLDVSSTLEQCDSLIQELAAQLSGLIDLDSFHPGSPPSPEEQRAAIELGDHAVMHGRSFCATKDGLVCNAMHKPENGDLITAFEGSERLFILRPAGARYRLIGEVYVDGLMKGEAYEGVDPDEVDYDIELV